MRAIYHLPHQVRFAEGLTGDQRLRMQSMIMAALRRVAQARTAQGQSADAEPTPGPALHEEFSVQRMNSAHAAYAIPSYDGGGALKEAPVRPAPP